MAWSTTDYTFKKILNKRSTDNTKRVSEEIGDYTQNIHFSEIWSENITWPPPAASDSVVEKYTKLELTRDTSVSNGQCWFATSDVTYPYDESLRLKKWISDKFNEDNTATYSIRLFQGDPGSALNDVEIYFNDQSNWVFDYQTGILTFQSSTLSTGTTTTQSGKVFKISGYRYIGSMGVAGASTIDGTGTTNYLPVFTDANTLADSIVQQIDGVLANGDTILQVDGVITAKAKSFDIPHPTKTGYRLRYGCLEGPENGVYHRGKLTGSGYIKVTLPEYWSSLVNSYTIHLTSYGNYSVYVVSQSQDSFIVARCGGWLDRRKNIEFTYEVIGDRVDAPLIIEYELLKNKPPG
jgi:hypothetical protein